MKQHIMVTGGIGNQMFIYALYLKMKSIGKNVVLDASMYDVLHIHNGYELNKYQIDELILKGKWYAYLYKILNRIFRGLFEKDNESYRANLIYTKKPYIDGYWQSARYFAGVEPLLREHFQFRFLNQTNQDMANRIKTLNSVSLHVRRGDYAGTPGEGICTEQYYIKAVKVIEEQVKDPYFFIFSDDIEYCKKLFGGMEMKYQIVDINHGDNNCYDIYLMSQCHHNIIANSSFSWWGAWLNANPNKIVVAPSRWNQISHQLRPQLPGWILIEV